MVIDAVVEMITEGQESFDRDGQIGPRRVAQRLWRASFPPYFHQARPDHRAGAFRQEFARSWWQARACRGGSGGHRHRLTAHSIAQYSGSFFPTPLPAGHCGGGAASTPRSWGCSRSSTSQYSPMRRWAFRAKPRKRWPCLPGQGGPERRRTTCRSSRGRPGFGQDLLSQAMDTARRCHPSYGQRR